jgi:ABC-type transport system substrate-binding protein
VFGDERLRKALSLAIDREAIVDSLTYGIGVAMTNCITHLFWAFNPNKSYYPTDLTEAKQLMSAAGVGDGFSFAMPGFSFVAQRTEAYQAQLRELGMKAEVRNEEIAQGTADSLSGNFDVESFTFDDLPEPDNFFTALDSTVLKRLGVFTRLDDEELNQAVQKATRVLEREERKKLYWDAIDIVGTRMYNSGVSTLTNTAATLKNVGGVVLYKDTKWRLRDLWLTGK